MERLNSPEIMELVDDVKEEFSRLKEEFPSNIDLKELDVEEIDEEESILWKHFKIIEDTEDIEEYKKLLKSFDEYRTRIAKDENFAEETRSRGEKIYRHPKTPFSRYFAAVLSKFIARIHLRENSR